MTTPMALNPEVLIPAAKIILTGSFGLSVMLAWKESEELTAPFLKLSFAFLSLLFFREWLDWLSKTGDAISVFISNLGDHQALKDLVLSSLSEAGKKPLANGERTVFNLPSVIEQAWRLGVWGILSEIADFFFLLSSFLIETAHRVFWQLMIFLFPLACGIFPLLPGILRNLVLYAVELSLWDAVLKMIQIATGFAARSYLQQQGSIGLPIVAVELIAIVLTFSIPTITHLVVSGALHSDWGGSMRSTVQVGHKWLTGWL